MKPLISAPILIEQDGRTVEGPASEVLSCMGQAIRQELQRQGLDDWNTLAIKCLIRVQYRLGECGYLARQVDP